MYTLKKTIKETFLILAIASGMMFGGAQQSKADGNDEYYNRYQYYKGLYDANPTAARYNSVYRGFALPNYYYWYAGEYSDAQGFQKDPYGSKSDKHLSSSYYSTFTYQSYWDNYYKYLGDFYWRTY